MYYKEEFDMGCYFYDNITSVFSLKLNTSGCVCTIQGGVCGSTPGLLFLR